MERPERPLGVSLAILASVMLFTLFPLMLVAMVLLVQRHFQNVDLGGLEPIAISGDFLGISPANLAMQTILSLTFLVIAVLAWMGHPPFIRYVLLAAVIAMTLLTLGVTISQAVAEQSLPQGVSSLDSLMRSVSCGQFALSVLVSLYVVWYLNRGPARAFYRGYYLPDPSDAASSPVDNGTENR